MHLASMRGHATVVELLLRRGGDVTLRNARHETALDVAARSGNAGVCKVLMERRPELTLQVGIGTAHFPRTPGYSPFSVRSRLLHLEMSGPLSTPRCCSTWLH
jgi:ankyrin repeat protein